MPNPKSKEGVCLPTVFKLRAASIVEGHTAEGSASFPRFENSKLLSFY